MVPQTTAWTTAWTARPRAERGPPRTGRGAGWALIDFPFGRGGRSAPGTRTGAVQVEQRARVQRAAGGAATEAGQSSVVLLGVLAVVVALCAGLGRLAVRAVGEAAAEGAADAVALAAAGAGVAAAQRVATANGAVIERLDHGPGWARVTVRRGPAVATSAAVLTEDDPERA